MRVLPVMVDVHSSYATDTSDSTSQLLDTATSEADLNLFNDNQDGYEDDAAKKTAVKKTVKKVTKLVICRNYQSGLVARPD